MNIFKNTNQSDYSDLNRMKSQLSALENELSTLSPVLNPIRTVQVKKQIAEMKRKIQKEESRLQSKQALPIIGIALVVLFGIMFIMAGREKRENSERTASVESSSALTQDSTTQESSAQESSVQESSVQESSAHESSIQESSVQESSIQESSGQETSIQESSGEESSIQESSTEESTQEAAVEDDNPYNIVYSFDVKSVTEYDHVESSSIDLGADEVLTITITASPADLEVEDFFFDYDDSILSYSIDGIETSGSSTIITVNVWSVSSGNADFGVFTSYAIYKNEETARGYYIPIHALNYEDGRLVYYTPTGECFHFSQSCAGENFGCTTLYDAIAAGLKPCGNCAD